MNKISCCAFLVTFFMCSAVSAATFGYSLRRCRELMHQNPPQIEVVYSFGSLRLDNSKDADGIKEVFKQIHPDQKVRKINGLTVLSPHAVVENNIMAEMIGEYICYYPQRVQINTGYTPIVYISKDLTKNRCRFTLTVRHEQTHLDIGHLSLQNFARRLKKEFSDIVENVGPVLKLPNEKVLNADDVAKEMNETYHTHLKVLFDGFVQKLLEENSRIDNDENYDYEQKLCPDI